jgi:hypothetical protein
MNNALATLSLSKRERGTSSARTSIPKGILRGSLQDEKMTKYFFEGQYVGLDTSSSIRFVATVAVDCCVVLLLWHPLTKKTFAAHIPGGAVRYTVFDQRCNDTMRCFPEFKIGIYE